MASIILILLLLSSAPLLIFAIGTCNPSDEQALLAIPAHLGRIPYFSSWTRSTSCCGGTWKGVECTDGRVTGLSIVGANVTGPIPLAIMDLRFLQTLTLKNLPNLSGRLHHQFNLLTNLTSLTISHTGVTYPVTSDPLFMLNELAHLDLSFNELYGPVPIPTQLSKLNYIDVSGNQFKGSLPSDITMLTNLKYLNVSYNNLCGPIPTGGVMRQFGPSSYVHNKCLCGTPLPRCK